MIMKNFAYSFLFSALTLGFFACDSDDGESSTPAKKMGSLTLHVQNFIINDTLEEPFELNKDYISPAGDTFNVSAIKYFISDVRLMSDDTMYMVPDSYYLIDGAQRMITLENVPEGKYTGIYFAL